MAETLYYDENGNPIPRPPEDTGYVAPGEAANPTYDLYKDQEWTIPYSKPVPLLTNIRESADKALAEGSDVYFTAPKGQEKPGDENYKYNFYSDYSKQDAEQAAKQGGVLPPGQKPSDAQLSAFQKWPAYKAALIRNLGIDPDADPVQEADRITTAMMVKQYGNRTLTASETAGLKFAFQKTLDMVKSKQADARRFLHDGYNRLLTEEASMRQKQEQRAYDEANKPPNETKLVIDAETERLGRKPTATELDTALRKRKVEIAEAGVTAKGKDINYDAIADSIAEGNDAPMAIKGSMGVPAATIVKSKLLQKYPKFNMAMSDANYKWKQSSTNQRTINFAGGALPRLGALDDQLSALPNTDINTINRVMAAVSKEFGKPEYTNYESNRNAIVQEVNTALSGTSQASDMRIKIELDNLKSARSPQQIRGAISNLREALIARMDVDLSPLYPIEVIRGEKTMEQHKKEMFDKYRGNYGIASQKNGGPKAGDVVKGYRFKGGNPADRNSWEVAR